MIIKKVLNNNVAVILNDKRLETVIMGKGIAFQKKPGDEIASEQVEKVFTLIGKETNNRFQELVRDIPLEYIMVSEKIIRYAKLKLDKKVSDSIYVTLTDHIAAAIENAKSGIQVQNALLWDIQQFFPDEFQIGKMSIEIVHTDIGLHFEQDEAAYIAMHFVYAQADKDIGFAHRTTSLILEITNIVKYHFHINYNLETQAYYRFVNHLKYFSQRLFSGQTYQDDDSGLLNIVKDANPRAYECVLKISQFIQQKYQHVMSYEEILCMTVHVARMAREAKE